MKSSFCKHAIVTQTDPKESSSLSTTCGVASPSSSPRRRYPAPQHRHVLPRAPQVVLCCALSQFAIFFLLSGHCIDIALLAKSNLKWLFFLCSQARCWCLYMSSSLRTRNKGFCTPLSGTFQIFHILQIVIFRWIHVIWQYHLTSDLFHQILNGPFV